MVASSAQFADGIPSSATAQLVDIYARAGQRLADVVTKPFGGTARARTFNRARAAELKQQVDSVLTETRGFTVAFAGKAAESAFGRGLASARRQLMQAGVLPSKNAATDGSLEGSFSVIDRRTIATIAADLAISLDAALSDQAKAAQRFLRAASTTLVADSAISQVIADGAISGDLRGTFKAMRKLIAGGAVANGEMAADLAENYRKAGSQVIKVGRAEMTLKSYAEMLVITRTREATVHARHERLVSNGVDLVSIVGRVSENFCSAYMGRVFSITGRSERYPSLSELPGGGPPFHPRCSKSTRAYVEEFATDAQASMADTPNDAYIDTDREAVQKAFDRNGEMTRAAARQQKLAAAIAGE